MHPYRGLILPPPGDPHGTAAEEPPDAEPDAEPGAVLRLVRDGAVPWASCPHCGGRLEVSTVGARWHVRHPSDIADRLVLQLGSLEREELHVLLLDTKCGVISQQRVYSGNVSAALVRVGELFTEAVRRNAAGMVLVHCHPSGDPTPSPDDLRLTAEAVAAGRLLDIAVIDHIVIGGGAYVSLRERGVAFGNPGDHRAGEASAGPPWRNPWLGTYKSCLQKAIRRGEPAKAAWAAERLLALPGGRSALARRLPVITAEDVGARWLPAVGRAIVAAEGSTAESGASLLIGTAASLSTLDKDRTCGYLASIVWGEGHLPLRTSRQALEEAIAAGHHEAALAIAFDALVKREWRSAGRAIEALLAALAQGPELTREIGRWALWRERLGGAVGECLAAAVIAAIDRPDGPIPELPPAQYEPLPASTRIDWYALDQHTAVGSRVLARQAQLLGMPPGMLAGVMFAESGIRCAPRELPSRWKTEALALDAIQGGWGTPEEGARLWASIRDAIRADIEQELGR
jgi:RadC-like JAB domain